ncbi:MAG: peptidyl-prolyl cis-trans isomerase [Candidatus Kuenenia sp.]|nr:peptidyl-prolyl cis-trans isomerase [Candidatus Kuenenia hertensis]
MTQQAPAETVYPKVSLETNHGEIVLELYPEKAPETVENFLKYVGDGFYNGTIFHRVIKGFMIQGGGLTEDMNRKTTLDPIKNEAYNGLKNSRGTVAMARTMDPHSATAQFFINTVDNGFLDFKDQTTRGWGYCVFGKVVKGMEVVDAIERLPTTKKAGYSDVPGATVIVKKAIEIK